MNNQTEIKIKYSNLIKINNNIENEITVYKKELNISKSNYKVKKVSYDQEIKKLNLKINDLKDKLSLLKKQNEEKKKLLSNNISNEVKKLIICNNNIIKDMINPILLAHNTLENKTIENHQIKEVKIKTEFYLFEKLQKEINYENNFFAETVNKLYRKFNIKLEEKEKNIKLFIEEYKLLRNNKKLKLLYTKKELINMYEAFIRINTLITESIIKKRINNNFINNLIKKADEPNNKRFPNLFKEINKNNLIGIQPKINYNFSIQEKIKMLNHNNSIIIDKNDSLYTDKDYSNNIKFYQKEIKKKHKKENDILEKIAKFTELKEKYSINDFNNLKLELNDLRKEYNNLMINNQKNIIEIEKNKKKIKNN